MSRDDKYMEDCGRLDVVPLTRIREAVVLCRSKRMSPEYRVTLVAGFD